MIMAMIFQRGWHPKLFQAFLLKRENHEASDTALLPETALLHATSFHKDFGNLPVQIVRVYRARMSR